MTATPPLLPAAADDVHPAAQPEGIEDPTFCVSKVLMLGFKRIVFIEPWWNCEPGDTARVPNKVAGALLAMNIARLLPAEVDEQTGAAPPDKRQGRSERP